MRNILVAGFAGLLGGIVSTVLMTTLPATAVVGERFPITTTGLTVVNEAGKARASLILYDGEHPALVLSDDRCSKRASLIVSEQGRTTLGLFGDNCKRRAALELQADDLPHFVLRDNKDVPRARLHLLPDGDPVLELFDQAGHVLKTLP